ncbi:hypothetical protein [Rufibacter roseus]|uniref:Uncharacterized protein n=1 Tax=Rufibacter roseus TaxID=1567108 RepID=A0ABW2DI49_9BACT|nr:hypothetical protein [Rufibacter roseus]
MKKVLPILLIGLLLSQVVEVLEYFLTDPSLPANGSDFTKNDIVGLVFLVLSLAVYVGVAYFLANHVNLGVTILLMLLLLLVDTLISENLTIKIADSQGLPRVESGLETSTEYLIMAAMGLITALIGYGINRMRRKRQSVATV